jgi:hypothetical protein
LLPTIAEIADRLTRTRNSATLQRETSSTEAQSQSKYFLRLCGKSLTDSASVPVGAHHAAAWIYQGKFNGVLDELVGQVFDLTTIDSRVSALPFDACPLSRPISPNAIICNRGAFGLTASRSLGRWFQTFLLWNRRCTNGSQPREFTPSIATPEFGRTELTNFKVNTNPNDSLVCS